MLELMLRTLIIGSIATAAAFLFERALTHMRMGTRYAWTFALLITLVLPFVPQLLPSSRAEVVPQIAAPAIVLTATSQIESRFPLDIALITWLLLTCSAVATYLVAYARLQQEKRHWRLSRVADTDVFVSRQFGPAVFGFLSPRIVVPEWIEQASAEEQKLVVLHEREHIRAGDQLQLLLTLVASAAMPWNPFIWLQSRRLDFRVETDCDQRVLATAPDAARYATLLVDVGSRQTGVLLTPALAEHRNGLERRLTMLGMRLIRNRWKAGAMMAVGVILTVVACEARLPQDPPQPEPQATTAADQSLPRKQVSTPRPPPDISELIARNYPPLLREAGVGGRAVVRAKIHASGKVDGYKLMQTSGHAALDEAALNVLRQMDLLPSKVSSGQPQDVTQEFAIAVVFDPQVRVRSASPLPPTDAETLPRKSIEQAPQFTPYDVKPELTNRTEVGELLRTYYPPLLRTAGIGGVVVSWVLIDQTGRVTKVQVKTSSGHEALDAAALKVISRMRFSPAQNKGEKVAVWVQLPVVFKTK